MDDKTTSAGDTAEYNYNESEVMSTDSPAYEEPEATLDSSDAVQEPAAQSSRIPFKFNLKGIDLKRLKRIDLKRLKVPGAIVLSILFIYIIFSVYASKKGQRLEQQKLDSQNKTTFVGQPKMPTSKSVSMQTKANAPMDMPIDASDPQVTQTQQVTQKKVSITTQQVESDQQHIEALADAVSKIEQEVSTTNQHIDQLTMAMQQLLVDVEKIKEATKPKPKKKAVKPPVAYHVRAIVHGRVWLRSAKGKNVSLRVGDKLEGYGVIRVISPRQGMVLMSNGSVIQYGVNDF